MEVRDKRVRVEVRMETLFEVFVPGDRRMPPVSEVLDYFREKYGTSYDDYEINSVDIHQDGWLLTIVALNWQKEIAYVESMEIEMLMDETNITIRRNVPHAHDCAKEHSRKTLDVWSRIVTYGAKEADKG